MNAPSHSDSISAILLELSSSSLLNQKGNDVTDFFAGLSDRLKVIFSIATCYSLQK